MRILQIHTRYRQRGGEDMVVDAERRVLESAGHEVAQYEIENPADALGIVRSLAVAPWNAGRSKDVRSVCRSFKPDVAHVHNTWYAASPSVIAAAAGEGVPVGMTLHNYRLVCLNGELLREGRACVRCVGHTPFPGVRYGCYRGSRPASAIAATTLMVGRGIDVWRRHVRRFAVLTRFAREIFVRGGLAEDSLTLVPNFVADPGSRADPPGRSDVVLFVGRLTAAKGVTTLVSAWASSPPSGLRLRIIGAGPSEFDLRKLATGESSIELAGRVEPCAVREEMLRARALVFPSEWFEGMPMTLLEAFSCGLPVLGSRIGSVEEIVGQLGSAWLVAPGDRGAWRSALSSLADEQQVDRAGELARRRYEAAFTPAEGLARRQAFYEALTSA